MKKNVILSIESVSKMYRLGSINTGTFVGDVERIWKTKILGQPDPFHKIADINDRASKIKSDFVWALKDINIEVNRGEVLGIIGKNGSGKSTLLKLLSRITAPTHGKIKVAGRIASLLEVGTGFHPELTGRENIFLNGAILGMTKNEIKNKFDDIVDFSGCALYIDTPTKRYSSGMIVRLGFAVAAFLDPEILIVDEVLSVGDFEFQQRAIGKMKEVSSKEGRTILFVSHNLGAVRALCTSGLFLEKGSIKKVGSVNEVISEYKMNTKAPLSSLVWYRHSIDKNIPVQISRVEISQTLGKLKIITEIISVESHNSFFIAFDVKSEEGVPIFQSIPSESPFIEYNVNPTIAETTIDLPLLIPGNYFLSVWIGSHYTITFDWQIDIVSFQISESPVIGRVMPHDSKNGYQVCNAQCTLL